MLWQGRIEALTLAVLMPCSTGDNGDHVPNATANTFITIINA